MMKMVQAQTYSSVKGERPGRRAEGSRRRPRRGSRKGTPPSKPTQPTSAQRRTEPVIWSVPLSLGPNIQVQARRGFRAVVQEIKPGMFLIAETPERQVTEFGAAILAPLLIKTAVKALKDPEATAQSARKVLDAGKGLVKRLPTRKNKALSAPSTPTIPVYDDPGHEEEDYIDPEFEDDTHLAGLLPAPRPAFMGRWVDPTLLAGLYRRSL